MSGDADISLEVEIDTSVSSLLNLDELQLDRFALLEFTQTDLDAMLEIHRNLELLSNGINETFAHFMYSTCNNVLLTDPAEARTMLDLQTSYIQLLTCGIYDRHYLRSRIAIGAIHRRLGLPFHQLISAYNKYQALIRTTILSNTMVCSEVQTLHLDALAKITCFDIGMALNAYCQGDKSGLLLNQDAYLDSLDQLSIQRNYDSLTGLRNRQSFKNQIGRILKIAEAKSTTIALIKLGLDHFKNLNDIEGYETGDLALREIGARIQNRLHKDDLVAYWGGDSFIVALNDIGRTANIDRVCSDISGIVNTSVIKNGKQLHLTCSMGIALYPQDGHNLESLLKFSDSAMTLAKSMGGNKFQFYNKLMDAQLNERISIANDIYSAIESNQFCLHYQPVADLQSGEIVGMEALVRWMHPVRGLMAPAQFISIAEEFSSINKLGGWIIRLACMDIQQWREQGISVPPISINVSPIQLLDPEFRHCILAILTEFDIRAQAITLEITESVLMHHDEGLEILLKEFKAKRFNLAMDDFGTGYSALQYLKHYPFDYVKIDQSFVRNILEDSNDAAIACAVIAMAHSMGIKVIAEGVESELQIQFLSQSMCDQIQGFYLSRPLPAQEAAQFIAGNFTLPDHLRRIKKISRTLLLVDDEPNILAALKRLFRPDGYIIRTAGSGKEGMDILNDFPVDVIVSDQRMPNMTGVEFLRQAKAKFPNTMRIVLSGYTELQSITDAINEGAIYKFLTKPWDDQQLRTQISEAFLQKEMFDENRRLELKIRTANQELATANRQLADILEQKERQLHRDEISLDIAREALEHLPIPMLGLDEDGMIAFANTATQQMLFKDSAFLGSHIDEILPAFIDMLASHSEGVNFSLHVPGFGYLANWRSMGTLSQSRGKLITFFKEP